jgi:hypothetical protein
MKLLRTVVVFDAADLDEESRFWAAVLKGRVIAEPTWHSVIDESGEWRMGFQLNPTHVKPEWPNGLQQQQIHLDLHATDHHEAHNEVLELGATLLQAADSMESEEGFQVYADPAGHPFCIGWGQPTSEQLANFLKKQFG